MAIHAISAAPMPVQEFTPARDTSSDEQARDRFAGMLATAHAHHAPKHAAPKPKDGTSELDGANAPADAKETTGASDDAAVPADAAATKVAASSSAPTNSVVSSIDALNPELQAKLARVMARVRDETGHDVKIEETYRTQGRQDALYAQGRDTAGPVVTWTQNSKHTQRRAVDVVLDGGAATPAAYATLQRIANEEGLRTLGARDPGHLELPKNPAGAVADAVRDMTTVNPAAPADASGPGQASIARLAQVTPATPATPATQVTPVTPVTPVAQVTRVAQVTQVAQVAQVAHAADIKVARPVQAARVANVASVAKPGTPTMAGTQDKPATTTATLTAAQIGQRQRGSASSDGDAQDSGSRGDQRGGYSSLGSTFTLRDQPVSGTSATSAVSGTSSAERAVKVMAAADDAPVRPLSQITMNVDAGNGTTDRIHVAMRGASLNTTIDVADARTAQVMTSRGDELVRSLSRDGIEVESMRVRTASATAAPVATQSSQSSSDSSSSSRFDRGNQWQQQERQESQNDRRQQQRDQREERQK